MPEVEAYDAKLVVTPDNSTRGSEGRIYLLLPAEMEKFVGLKYRCVGVLSRDDALIMIPSPEGSTITPKRQFWWKNGVRDHGIRRNHSVRIWMLEYGYWFLMLTGQTDEDPPQLPPYQDILFER